MLFTSPTFTRSRGFLPLLKILINLSLTTNLKLCLDAGDVNSYSSGQTWSDVSGGGYHFFRGVDGSSGTDDPTFAGTVGNPATAEWTFDGGDFFKNNTVAGDFNSDVVNAFHKDNAALTMIALIHPVLTAVTNDIFGTRDDAANNDVGCNWQITDGEKIQFHAHHASGNALNALATETINASAYNFCAVSVDEAAGGTASFHMTNGTFDTFDGTYTTPSSAAAAAVATVARDGAGTGDNFLTNGYKLSCFAIFNVALSQTNITDIYTQLRTRVGI